jgi:hypothetical protein
MNRKAAMVLATISLQQLGDGYVLPVGLCFALV